MHFLAEVLIGNVVGTQRIAVQDQDAAAIKFEDFFLWQQGHQAVARKAAAKQKIAVAVNEEAGNALLV